MVCVVFVLRCVVVCPKSGRRMYKGSIKNHVWEVVGPHRAMTWAHFGPKGSNVSAGTENCFQKHVFYGGDFRKLAFCMGVVTK